VKDADAVVFVVDDDSSVREAIKSLSKSVGLRVETCETAQQFMVEGPQLRRAKRLHDRSAPELPHMVRFAATRFARDLARWPGNSDGT
jgi:FixJ family two-component response regulator